MLATLQRVLRAAQRGRYAVGAFNVSNLEQVQAVIAAANALHSPVIVNTSEKALDYGGVQTLGAMVVSLAHHSRVPVVLNLDHGRSLDQVRQCLRRGWTGIMFDGSRLSWRENIRQTSAARIMAHKLQIGIEGEIGQVKYPSELATDPRLILATPGGAQEFVRRTKIDALAVGIGNSHGLPQKHERLDFTLLAHIRQAVRVPLVLHGASGTPPASIRRTIQLGICKINIDTDLRLAFTAAVRKALRSSDFDPRSYLAPGREAVAETVKKKIILFGSKGRA